VTSRRGQSDKKSKDAEGNGEVSAKEPSLAKPCSGRKRKFTKEFKEAIVRRVEDGIPLKRVASAHNLDPAAVRAWRAELQEMGPDAFSAIRKRHFAKEFKEAAVRRLEGGLSVKEVARDCRVDPATLGRWRSELRDLGASAFLRSAPRSRPMILKLTESEFHRLKAIAKAAGARSVSAFARSRLFGENGQPSRGATR
jgi:transposase-like protein